jgi:hypothetical protein
MFAFGGAAGGWPRTVAVQRINRFGPAAASPTAKFGISLAERGNPRSFRFRSEWRISLLNCEKSGRHTAGHLN